MTVIDINVECLWKAHKAVPVALERALVLAFGRNAHMLVSPDRWEGHIDHCLPWPGTPNYEALERVWLAIIEVVESHVSVAGDLDERLCGYWPGLDDDGYLPTTWVEACRRIDASGELKDGLIAEIKAKTLGLSCPD